MQIHHQLALLFDQLFNSKSGLSWQVHFLCATLSSTNLLPCLWYLPVSMPGLRHPFSLMTPSVLPELCSHSYHGVLSSFFSSPPFSFLIIKSHWSHREGKKQPNSHCLPTRYMCLVVGKMLDIYHLIWAPTQFSNRMVVVAPFYR